MSKSLERTTLWMFIPASQMNTLIVVIRWFMILSINIQLKHDWDECQNCLLGFLLTFQALRSVCVIFYEDYGKKIILRNYFATWKCKFRMQCISRGGLCREVVTSVDSFLMPCYAEVTPMMSYVDKWLTSCYAQVAFSARLSNRVACCSKCLPYITAKTLVVCCKCNLKSRGYR